MVHGSRDKFSFCLCCRIGPQKQHQLQNLWTCSIFSEVQVSMSRILIVKYFGNAFISVCEVIYCGKIVNISILEMPLSCIIWSTERNYRTWFISSITANYHTLNTDWKKQQRTWYFLVRQKFAGWDYWVLSAGDFEDFLKLSVNIPWTEEIKIYWKSHPHCLREVNVLTQRSASTSTSFQAKCNTHLLIIHMSFFPFPLTSLWLHRVTVRLCKV